MEWTDLSRDAKSILEWVEHVYTGKRQLLTIKRGEKWIQPLKYHRDVVVNVTDELFNEIRLWLPYSPDTVFSADADVITVTLKDGVKLH